MRYALAFVAGAVTMCAMTAAIVYVMGDPRIIEDIIVGERKVEIEYSPPVYRMAGRMAWSYVHPAEYDAAPMWMKAPRKTYAAGKE